MKRFYLLLICTCFALHAPRAAARETIAKGDVAVVPLQGEISPSMFAFLRRAQKAAETAEVAAIILDMNTYVVASTALSRSRIS